MAKLRKSMSGFEAKDAMLNGGLGRWNELSDGKRRVSGFFIAKRTSELLLEDLVACLEKLSGTF